jgi:hypothetical protein
VHRAGANLSESRRRRAIGVVFIPTNCVTDPRLLRYHEEQLAEDIELQKIKNPKLYANLSKSATGNEMSAIVRNSN